MYFIDWIDHWKNADKGEVSFQIAERKKAMEQVDSSSNSHDGTTILSAAEPSTNIEVSLKGPPEGQF